jgi:site-specific recombinase XerD
VLSAATADNYSDSACRLTNWSGVLTLNHSTQTSGDLAINITSFKRHLSAENKSPKTIKSYLEACTQLSEFLKSKGMPQYLGDIKREHIEHYINDLLERRTPATAANRFRSLRAFFKWAIEEGEVSAESSPMANMKVPKVPEKEVRVLTGDEISSLLAACRGAGFEARRDLAILRMFVTTGARRLEIATLRFDPENQLENDIDLDQGVARVLGKGGRDRLVPLDPRTVKALDRYLRVRARHPHSDMRWLWLGKKGQLTEDGLRQMLERRAEKAGLGHLHLHQLRHSFAHHWLVDGGSESDLMRIAGWKSQEMVRKYASSTAQERAIKASRRFGLGSRI